MCISFEKRVARPTYQPPAPAPLVCARLLGYMMVHAPIASGRENIANEILACINDTALANLAKFYINHFLRCCK